MKGEDSSYKRSKIILYGSEPRLPVPPDYIHFPVLHYTSFDSQLVNVKHCKYMPCALLSCSTDLFSLHVVYNFFLTKNKRNETFS